MRTMRDRTDEELCCLLYRDAQNYTPDAIIAAREEFSRRQLDEPTMSRVDAAAEKALDETKVMSDTDETGTGWGWSDYGNDLTKTATGWGCLILLCFVGYGIYGGYEWLDGDGLIPHDHDTPVWIQGDWLVGEYRACGMLTTTPPVGVTLSQEVSGELPRLLCGKAWDSEGVFEFVNAMPDVTSTQNALLAGGDWSAFDRYFHVLPVRYSGRIERPDKVYISWRCQRNTSSLTCWALN